MFDITCVCQEVFSVKQKAKTKHQQKKNTNKKRCNGNKQLFLNNKNPIRVCVMLQFNCCRCYFSANVCRTLKKILPEILRFFLIDILHKFICTRSFIFYFQMPLDMFKPFCLIKR